MTSKGIADEPDFSWWVSYKLSNKDRIIAVVNSCAKKRKKKYGIEIPNSVKHAGEIDKCNGNTYCQEEIYKEMFNVYVGLKILEHGEHVLIGWTKSIRNTVFDVRRDSTRNKRWVKDGHKHP